MECFIALETEYQSKKMILMPDYGFELYGMQLSKGGTRNHHANAQETSRRVCMS
jgi:hypothetical protein